MNAYRLPGHDQWLSAPYDEQEDAPEPTKFQVDQAFDDLMFSCPKSFCDFTDNRGEDLASLMCIYRKWDGMPSDTVSEDMSASYDRFNEIMKRLDEGYRDVVRDNGELEALAQEISTHEWEVEIQDRLNDAEEP